MEANEDKCFICDKVFDRGQPTNIVNYKEVAINRMRTASLKRKDKKYVFLKGHTSIDVHKSCYINYINEGRIKAAKEHQPSTLETDHDENVQLEHEVQHFDFTKNCFFCGSSADEEYIKNNRRHGPADKRVYFIKKRNDKIQQIATENNITDYMKNIENRIKNIDLVAVKARYHHNCFVYFHKYDIQRSNVKGRPFSETTVDVLDFIQNYIVQNPEECQYSLQALVDKYQECHEGVARPNLHNLKDRIVQIFDTDLRVYENGSDYNLIYVDNIDEVLNDSFNTSKNQEEEEERIITLAGRILSRDIRSRQYDLDHYPPPSDFLKNVDEHVPPLLRKLLDIIICSHKKSTPENMSMWNHRVTMFSHAIIASARPRSFLSPLLLGISALLHKKHASRTLIDCLAHLGVAESYSETLKFEDTMSRNKENLNFTESYIQMVYDNCDHNTKTIDGKNTFHATGGIKCVTPASSVVTKENIRRPSTKQPPLSGEFGFLPVQHFIKPNKSGLNNIILEKINSSKESFQVDITAKDFLWSYNKYINPEECPGWNGFHEQCAHETLFQISKIVPSPFINAPISNYDTIFTVLREANAQCRANKQSHIMLTFDLPPFQKATEVLACVKGTPLEEQVSCVVLRVGGLHVAMSFGGSIGNIMQGSGLEETLSQIYAENSVDKILSGHAYSRMFRGHTLVDCALNQIVIKLINLKTEEIATLSEVLKSVGTGAFHELVEKIEFLNIYDRFKDELHKIEAFGPTAKLWVQYMRMVEILKLFIEAERTGNWTLHLYSLRSMLPYLHAAGHTAYAKYLQWYLQDMDDLKNKMNPQEYNKLTEQGFFTIRRTNKFRSGIASDQTIEQMFMRPFKDPKEGVTHGRGLSENVLQRYILSSVSLISVVDAIESYCKIQYHSSEQHVDTSNARISRDNFDLKKLLAFFANHNPFPQISSIMSITTGVIGNETINCYQAFENGFEALNHMEGPFGKIKMSRKYKVIPLKAATSSVKVDGNIVAVDENLIYQRMIINIQKESDRQKYLGYELAPYPVSLFKHGLMRKTKKASFYDFFNEVETLPDTNVIYVIDGGFLLHKYVWQNNNNVGSIVDGYVRYVSKLPGIQIVVFDGYSDVHSSTKEFERLRRQNKNSCCDIQIDRNTTLTVNQEKFLSNSKNKKQLIDLLCQELEKNKIETVVANEDADMDIVKTAIEQNKNNSSSNVIIMGEDVDLLVLLTYFAHENNSIYYLKANRGNVAQKVFTSNSFKYPSLKNLILFMHAFSGCDTTSAFFKKGKTSIANILIKDSILQNLVKVFYDPAASVENVNKHGCEVVRQLYSTQMDKESLKDLRFKKFSAVTIKSSLKLESLPPTEAAAKQHSLRVYHQVQKWLGNEKNATEWGWDLSDGILKPKYSDEPLIPDDLLIKVSCNCKTGCKTKQCGCRKNGAHCSSLCGSCGDNCSNCVKLTVDENTFSLEADNEIEAFIENHGESSIVANVEDEDNLDFDDDENEYDENNESQLEESENEEESMNPISNVLDRKRRHSRDNDNVASAKKKIL